MDEEVSYQHKKLTSGRWKEFSVSEQMSKIGSEVNLIRAVVAEVF